MSRDGASPVTRPLSVLHIGYDWPYPFIAQGGFRYWQDIGIMTMALTDNMYSGLRKKDPVDPTGRTSQVISPTNGADDDQDAVIS